jgi:hypothetical protein
MNSSGTTRVFMKVQVQKIIFSDNSSIIWRFFSKRKWSPNTLSLMINSHPLHPTLIFFQQNTLCTNSFISASCFSCCLWTKARISIVFYQAVDFSRDWPRPNLLSSIALVQTHMCSSINYTIAEDHALKPFYHCWVFLKEIEIEVESCKSQNESRKI